MKQGEERGKKKSGPAALCCDMLDALQKQLSCVSQVTQGQGIVGAEPTLQSNSGEKPDG